MSLFDQLDEKNGDELAVAGAKLVTKHAPSIEVGTLDAAIMMLARTRESFTAEDVRERAGSDWHPNLIGARFLYMSRVANIIEQCGYTKSARIKRHSGIIRVWRARRWA